MFKKLSVSILVIVIVGVISIELLKKDIPPPPTPIGPAIPLTDSMRDYIITPEHALHTPALLDPAFLAKSDIKSTSPTDFFLAKNVIASKLLLETLAKYADDPGQAAALTVIAQHIKPTHVIRTPAHQFMIDGTLGNRIIFYGGDNEFDQGPGHKNIDKFAHDVNMPLIKIMTHFNDAQGGSLMAVLENGNGGMTHGGSYYPGWVDNKPIAVRSDWPADYGYLGDDNITYNAHLFAVDYQAGTDEIIPERTLVSYKQNYALWDVETGLAVPFVRKSKIEEYQDYKNNPLEAYNKNKLLSLATKAATLDKNVIEFTSYCSEGVWNNMNLAANVMIQKGTFPEVDKLFTLFQSAPKYQTMTGRDQRRNPQIGWQWLLEKKAISQEEYQAMLISRRTGIFLDWIGRDIKPITAYTPQRSDGLIADPMTLGTMVRMLLRSYFPREAVTKALYTDILELYTTTKQQEVKDAITTLLQGFAPDNFIGEFALQKASFTLANMQFSLLLQFPEFKKLVFNKLGYQHIANDEDKQKVDDLYEKYIEVIMDPEITDRKELDQALATVDKEFENLQVTMKIYGPTDTTERTHTQKVNFFMWTPPHAFAYWAQYPDMFNSTSIRYAATAMHYDQSQELAKKAEE